MGSEGSRKRRVPGWVWWVAFLALWVVVMGAARDAIGWVTDQAVPSLVATGGYWLSNTVAVAVVAVLGLPALWGQHLRYRRIELEGDPHPPVSPFTYQSQGKASAWFASVLAIAGCAAGLGMVLFGHWAVFLAGPALGAIAAIGGRMDTHHAKMMDARTHSEGAST